MYSTVSERSFAAIGRVAVASADLDMALMAVLEHLIASDRAALIVAGQPYSYLDQAIRALGKKYLSEDGWNILVDLLAKAKPLHEKRDLIVHGTYLPQDVASYIDGQDQSSFFTVRTRRWKSDLHGKIVDVAEIEELAGELISMAASIGKFQFKFLPQLDPRGT